MYYWQATLKDGTIVQETADVEQSRETWKRIESSVQSLRIIGDETSYVLPDELHGYQQGKGASIGLGGEDFRIESHWISGQMPNGQRIKLRVFTNQKKVSVEICDS